MVKFVKVDSAPTKAEAGQIIQDFLEAGMKVAKLDLSDEDRAPATVYASLYQYLRLHTEIKVTLKMVKGDLYLEVNEPE